eukprot:gene16141-biopygen13757
MGTSSVGLLRLCGFYLKVPCLALDAPCPSDAPSRTRFPMACQLKSPLGAAALLFAALLNHWGQKGPAEVPKKREWTYRWCTWWAQQQNIPFCIP